MEKKSNQEFRKYEEKKEDASLDNLKRAVAILNGLHSGISKQRKREMRSKKSQVVECRTGQKIVSRSGA